MVTRGVLFLENFPFENAGYQYRAGKWKTEFEKNGLRCEVWTIFPDKRDFEVQFENLPLLYIRAMRKRFRQCIYARKFKTVVVRRELLQFNDYGNLFMEKFLLKIHSNVILDFDDDISAAKREPRSISSLYAKLMQENGNKFNDSLKLYGRFVVGSNYLKEKLLFENKNIEGDAVLVVPTCVDYDVFPAKVYDGCESEIVLGWIGGSQNLHYLDMLVKPLNRLAVEYKFKLVVVSGCDYENAAAKFKIENRMWSLATEKDLIRSFDVGLMPIEDNEFCRGKCGFKLLQYMGLGVVGVATDVTVNGEIIDDGKNGFLVKPDNSNWYEVLKKVLSLQANFSDIGKSARQTVEEKYSFSANVGRYMDFVKR
ncbi:MAG: glycosyltransferase family 4 protein [Bacteroidales bacterium]|nr:glycosyltransferase family 4 protein [Bacteroidales bacterium]